MRYARRSNRGRNSWNNGSSLVIRQNACFVLPGMNRVDLVEARGDGGGNRGKPLQLLLRFRPFHETLEMFFRSPLSVVRDLLSVEAAVDTNRYETRLATDRAFRRL